MLAEPHVRPSGSQSIDTLPSHCCVTGLQATDKPERKHMIKAISQEDVLPEGMSAAAPESNAGQVRLFVSGPQ